MTDSKPTETELLQIIYSLKRYLGVYITVKERKMIMRKVHEIVFPRLTEICDEDYDLFIEIVNKDIFDSFFE